jgi:hypothetical protein
MRSDPIGPTFTVTKDEPATLRFDVSACHHRPGPAAATTALPHRIG